MGGPRRYRLTMGRSGWACGWPALALAPRQAGRPGPAAAPCPRSPAPPSAPGGGEANGGCHVLTCPADCGGCHCWLVQQCCGGCHDHASHGARLVQQCCGPREFNTAGQASSGTQQWHPGAKPQRREAMSSREAILQRIRSRLAGSPPRGNPARARGLAAANLRPGRLGRPVRRGAQAGLRRADPLPLDGRGPADNWPSLMRDRPPGQASAPWTSPAGAGTRCRTAARTA